MQKKSCQFVVSCLVLALLAGCQSCPPDVLALGPTTLKNRQIQTKKFDTLNETSMLTASMEVLQDMGFMINETDSKLGVIVASKERATDNRVQRVALVALTILGGGTSFRGIESMHKIRVSLVTIPDKNKHNTAVRINFQRQVFDMEGNMVKLESINEPALYVGFFSKLSKSVFLEAHEI